MENYFGTPSPRIAKMREELLDTKPQVCVERAIYTTEAYKQHKDKMKILQRAYAVENTLKKMTIFIEDGGLLAGNQASVNRAAPIFPEYAIDWVVEELDLWEKRDGDAFYISEENKQVIRDIAPFWEGRTLKDKGLALMPPLARKCYDLGIIKVEGNITAGDGHLAVNYEKLLKEGLGGIRKETEEAKAKLHYSDYNDLKKVYFYDAVLILIDASIAFAHRYAALAREQAASCTDPKRKEELLRLAEVCMRVPEYPAESFYEAVQSVWFLQLILQIESNGHSLSFGRFDQFMYPYYKKDIESGAMTEDEALELLENLWLKTFTINKIRSNSHTKFSAGSPLYQNVCIGGQLAGGVDAVNPLSFLVLKSIGQLKLTQPNLSVRYHKGISDEFMYDCIQMIKLGFGMPSFNSDEIIIDQFIDKGVAPEDAVNYSSIGCIEVSIPGKFGLRCSGMNFLNFPRILMITLNQGVDVTSGEKIYDVPMHFRDMTSFEQVWQAWVDTVKFFTPISVTLDNCADYALEMETPDSLCSALVDDCIKRGKHLKEGGAIYDFIGPLQVGIANLGDSLAAIKKLVFEEKRITPGELWDALMSNFENEGGWRIQQMLLHDAPKYGNDDDYVDKLTADAYQVFIDEIAKYHNTRYGRGPIGGGYFPGTSSISANVPQGANLCATPDGRKKGEPLAEGCSPTHSVDTHGPTAVFKSVSKLPTLKLNGGVLLNQKLNPSSLQQERDIRKLILMLRTFFDDLKGYHVQYNVVDKETLLDAQKHPEAHRDLIVRVAGYSAFFNVLSTETQNDIIARTEHVL
ncbi:formate C-acetyltransferase/glycerol dehydratase family glycyl radical enzyme [Lachnoclostridium sp. An131]|jgi:pyruvate formate-lyase/glycerol dehydratase family glycyl radical enzyme|uniref:glycyl radical protein n=1 Tax=Lachnoclostridium sp. An131 TaxID=1965555 RepID=UPI000B38913A|nr:glycyl radical protein [Lachnoclostridium sp. An131]OUQ24657.1 formate C-acetyltransferase/glycerol dehydratase family glycyl radical enzyme [Lachnoclostridium sp. An131]